MAVQKSYTFKELSDIIAGLAQLMVSLQQLGIAELLTQATNQRATAQNVRQNVQESGATTTTPTQSAQVAAIESSLEGLTVQVKSLQVDHDTLAGVVTEVNSTVHQHGTRLNTVEARLSATKDSAEASAQAVARAHARIDGLDRSFNWLAAAITMAIGFALWLFWYIPTDFGGTVTRNGVVTDMKVPSVLDTLWGDAFGMLVVLALAMAVGWIFSTRGSDSASAEAGAVASARSGGVHPVATTPAPVPNAPVANPLVDPAVSVAAAAHAVARS